MSEVLHIGECEVEDDNAHRCGRPENHDGEHRCGRSGCDYEWADDPVPLLPAVLPLSAKSLDEIITPIRWLSLEEARERFPDSDPVPLCPVCGKEAPVRAWCSAECEAFDETGEKPK